MLSDYKPLESIFKKPLFKVPPKLRLRLRKYYLKVKYVLGKFLKIADTLFKTFDQTSDPNGNDMHHDNIMLLPISQSRMLT